MIQQFFSAGLLGEPPVWSKIVFKMAGVTTFAELARDAPVEAHTYRKGVYAAATTLEIQQAHRLRQPPWYLAVVPDTRRPVEARREAARRVHQGCKKCVDRGFGLQIRTNFPTPELVMSQRCLGICGDWTLRS